MNKNPDTNSNSSDEFLTDMGKAKQVFLSFAVKIDPVNFFILLNDFVQKPGDVFYFCQPDKNITFLSFDELTVQSFNTNEFNLITKEIEVLNNKLISNHDEFPGINFPVFLTCIKFPTNKSSNEWEDFGEIDFIIPKLSLYKNSDSYFLLYNVLSESFSNHENLNEILENNVEKIFQLELKLKDNISDRSKISLIEQSDDESKWSAKISDTLESIKQKHIAKIVLSRRIKHNINSVINWQSTFNELNEKYPNCTNFLLKSNDAIFFGSTPELLAGFSGNQFFTEALAGSIMRGNDLTQDVNYETSLLKSEKNKFEHDVVTNHLKDSLQNFVEKIEIDERPIVKKFSNIQHLQTGIKGTLKPGSNIFEIISSLFPTPAVCGIPKEKSLQMISELEEFDRGLFSGLIGWFNCKGFGEFNVAIRSALINKNLLYTYAGCGIVEGSDPLEEFEETKLKLKPILSLFDNADKS